MGLLSLSLHSNAEMREKKSYNTLAITSSDWLVLLALPTPPVSEYGLSQIFHCVTDNDRITRK
jgi:hypothetical protein